MIARQIESGLNGSFEILGINKAEERVYRWLLNHDGATRSEVVRGLGLPREKAQRLFEALESKGLATHVPTRPQRYLPFAPNIALESLALRRQEELQSAQVAIQDLQEQITASRPLHRQEQIVEIITSREAEREIVEQMARTALHEIVVLVRPPMVISKLEASSEQDQVTQRQAQARGVRSRSIVDREFLALPGAVSRVRGDIKSGEEVRVSSNLPSKMIITDRRVALIPLNLEQSDGPLLLVRSSALLETLYALFEILWHRAAPISLTASEEPRADNQSTALPEIAEELIMLMAAGLNDKKIAHEMGISSSTLNRRIREMMNSLDARTRFQIGWLAALRRASR
jgi:sugar-specific transcriptional regulator TrmB